MKAKLALLVGGAAGYVFGTRDGRQRYEQLKTSAQTLWQDPKVQEQVGRVTKKTPGSEAGRSAEAGSVSSETPTQPATSEPVTGNLTGNLDV